MNRLRSGRFVGALAVLAWTVGPTLAHPHIFVDSTARIVFDRAGRLAEIRHNWVFDEAFSAWVTQGLDVNGDGQITPDEMQELADENLSGLAEFEYYTFAGEGKVTLAFAPVGPARMHMEGGRVVLDFAIAPATPYPVERALEIEVSDPEYYVAFSFASDDSGVLVGAPPGCRSESHAPQPLSDADARRLAAIGPEQVELPPDLRDLVRDQTNIIEVMCPTGATGDPVAPAEPSTALEAIDAATRPLSAPFGGPPPERSLPMPKTGLFGWINEQQKAFYVAMSNGVAAFRNDGSAFFLLGTLSFLYGIFHAAGPGHGKVVVSSYMLAGERQLRNGIILSFAAAMAQSLTAIVFVLIAAAALNMTRVAMNSVAAWSEIASYALVLALGLWLLLRKLLGLGNDHDHHHAHADHRHHPVVVTGRGRNWREALGMVLAIGLRPCSGALVVLVFALSQGVLLAGIGAVLLMGLGTALTVAVLASLAVGAKALATKIGTRAEGASHAVAVLEILGALLLVLFGAVMLLASLSA